MNNPTKLLSIVAAAIMATAACAFGQNNWNTPDITFDSANQQLTPVSKEFARGESWLISPLLLDSGVPRAWSNTARFVFAWQSPSMKTNWWTSTNVANTVYHNVTITNTVPYVTYYVTSLTNVTVAAGINGTATTNYTYAVSTNTVTSYVTGYTVTNIVDTGRCSAVWIDAMDYGFNNYNWYIGYMDANSNITYRMNGTITMRGSPGYGGTVTNAAWSYPWATTNYANSIFNQMLWLSNSPYASGYFYLMAPN